MSSGQLFVAEVRAYPGRVAGAGVACAVTAAGMGACLALLVAVTGRTYPENSAGAALVNDAENLLSIMLSMLLMGGVLVIGSTVSLWTGQRLQQFAVLRALGASAGRLRWMVVGDVARLALPAAALGTVVGTPIAAYLGRRMLIENELFPASTHLPSAGSFAIVVAGVSVGSVTVAVLAALGSIVAAGRVSAIGLLKDEGRAMAPRRSRARLVTGLLMVLMLCLPIPILIVSLNLPAVDRAGLVTGLAVMVIPTLAVLGPWIVPVLTWPVCVVLRTVDRRVGRIAAAGLRAAPLRTAAIAVPVLLAVGTAVCVLGSAAILGAAKHRQTEQALLADGVVTAKPGTELSATPATAQGVSATTLVATRITLPASADDYDEPETDDAWGVQGDALRRFLDLDVRRGRLADLGEGTFAAGASEVQDRDWHLGQRVDLRLSDGSARTLRLVAIYRRDLAFPTFLLPLSTALAHTAHPYADRILLAGDLHAWPVRPGQKLLPRAEYLDQLSPRSPQDDLAGHLVVAVIVGYALLAAANTCALAQRDRRAQRAHLRALGLGRLQLARCVLYEVLGAAAVGLGLAAATAVMCLPPFSVALGMGAVPALDTPWTAGVLAAAVAVVAIPALLAARPLQGIQRQFATGVP